MYFYIPMCLKEGKAGGVKRKKMGKEMDLYY
jgi:hypothetical protein